MNCLPAALDHSLTHTGEEEAQAVGLDESRIATNLRLPLKRARAKPTCMQMSERPNAVKCCSTPGEVEQQNVQFDVPECIHCEAARTHLPRPCQWLHVK